MFRSRVTLIAGAAAVHFAADPLAEHLLKGEFAPGDTILADKDPNSSEMTFTKKRRAAVAAVS